MTKQKAPSGHGKNRLDRRADALRENLLKRKRQDRARADETKKEKP